MTLPNAIEQNPACGSCGSETRWHILGFKCEECQLRFDEEAPHAASFLDSAVEPCGAPCDNWWHGDDRIGSGIRYTCHPCQLPANHAAKLHWTGCEQKPRAK